MAVAGLAMAHAAVGARGDDYVGWLLVLDHLFALATVGALFAVGLAAGRLVLDRLGLPLD